MSFPINPRSLATAVFAFCLFALPAKGEGLQCPNAFMEMEISTGNAYGSAEAIFPASPDPSQPSGVAPPAPAYLSTEHDIAKARGYNDMVSEWMQNEGLTCFNSGGTDVIPNGISTIFPGGQTSYSPDFPGFPGNFNGAFYPTPGGGWAYLAGPTVGCSADLENDMGTYVYDVKCGVMVTAPFGCCHNMEAEMEGGEGGAEAPVMGGGAGGFNGGPMPPPGGMGGVPGLP